MKRINLRSSYVWNSILMISVIFAAFVLPLLPVYWHKMTFRLVYSIIYVAAIFSLEKKGNTIFVLSVATFIIEWVSGIFDLEVLNMVSRAANVLFFLFMVILLIQQIASAKKVTAGVILGSITGYLLLGIVYSIFITVIIKLDPAAYSNIQADAIATEKTVDTSIPLYYSFVTIASLGYGDICPLKPYSRSLATLITVSGQFYMATIVALLVGKFSSGQSGNS